MVLDDSTRNKVVGYIFIYALISFISFNLIHDNKAGLMMCMLGTCFAASTLIFSEGKTKRRHSVLLAILFSIIGSVTYMFTKGLIVDQNVFINNLCVLFIGVIAVFKLISKAKIA